VIKVDPPKMKDCHFLAKTFTINTFRNRALANRSTIQCGQSCPLWEVRVRYVLAAVLLSTGALAQEGYIGHDHHKWHQDFYQRLVRPDTRVSCCSLSDCRPTSGRVVGDHYEVKVNGAWVAVPPDKIVKRSAPDMGFHVCAPHNFSGKPEHLYCVVLPPET
jgi:hypothetical protein